MIFIYFLFAVTLSLFAITFSCRDASSRLSTAYLISPLMHYFGPYFSFSSLITAISRSSGKKNLLSEDYSGHRFEAHHFRVLLGLNSFKMSFLFRRSPINVMEGMMRFVNKPTRSTGRGKNVHISKRAQQGAPSLNS